MAFATIGFQLSTSAEVRFLVSILAMASFVNSGAGSRSLASS
ncbi:hypothetical protein [Sorangium sp. So ce1151]